MASLFVQFLKRTREFAQMIEKSPYQLCESTRICFVLGNESADMDSTLGSMILAYMRCNSQKLKVVDLDVARTIYLPIVQCKRNEIQSRFEIMQVLQTNSIEVNDLIFKEDIDLQKISQSYKFNVLLFDHNCTTYSELKSFVSEIIDHHVDKTTSFYEESQQITKIITTVGSATTLLGELFEKENLLHLLEPAIADSIMKTILLDTYNFDPAHETTRWNIRDQSVYHLMAKFLNKSSERDRITVYQELQNLKFDVASNLALGPINLFTKDYKKFLYASGNVIIGYSAIMIPQEEFLSGYPVEVLENFIDQFISEQKIDIFVLLFASPNKRSGIILANRNNLPASLIYLKKVKEAVFSLKEQESILVIDRSQSFDKYQQSNFAFSANTRLTRKLVEPLIASIFIDIAPTL